MTSMGPRRSGRLKVFLAARLQGRAGPERAIVRRFAGLLVTATLLGACGGPAASPAGPPGASASPGPGASANLAPRDISTAAADAVDHPGDLPAPPVDPESGDVPPAEPATPPLGGHLALGSPGVPVSSHLGTAGGSLSADGLAISIPAQALSADTSFSVTATPITGTANASDYGGAVIPVGPLYTVAAPGADLVAPANVTLTYTLPAGAPAGASVLAFYYDPDSGAIAPLSPVSDGSGTLTALATHFSDLFAGLVDWNRLPATVDSGFRPGVDDWEFDNYGSYVAPGGQCEGQSLSEIWYYATQRQGAGASPLYGVYDNNGSPDKTPTFWQDDSEGYRFAASVHADPIVDQVTYLQFRNSQWASADGALTYEAFRAAIAFSGEPQMIRISPDGIAGGHTMVVYRVSPSRLFVADPNYVGHLRTILYDPASGQLSPYSSGDSATSIAAGGDTSYTHFAYVPWLAARTAASIAARWAEFEANVAGNTTFPSYRLLASSGKDAAGKDIWVPLVDGFSTDQASLPIQVTRLGDDAATIMAVFPGTATTMSGHWGWLQTLDLAPGENAFGLLIDAKKGDAWQYVDFVRLTVNGPTPSPTPTSPVPSFGEPVSRTIDAIVPIGGVGENLTCPAKVTLSFTPSGGDPNGTGPTRMAAAVGLWAQCTNVDFSAIDAAGTFDGHTFSLEQGRWTYTGTFDGSNATITGRGQTLVFPVGP